MEKIIEQAVLQLQNHVIVLSFVTLSIGCGELIAFNLIMSLYKRMDKIKEEMLNPKTGLVVLPNIYAGKLNTYRITKQHNICQEYNVDGDTVRGIFCKGADFYREVVEDANRKKSNHEQ